MYVDDALMASQSVPSMKQLMAATIEAIFVIMGVPNEAVRQCPLALNKWRALIVQPKNIILGLGVCTRKLALSITSEYRMEILTLLNKSWHSKRFLFELNEIQRLLGKLARLAKGAPWIFHVLTHMYSSVAYALSRNKQFLAESSPEFQALVKEIEARRFKSIACKNQAQILRFVMKKHARMVHHSKRKYEINKSMRTEIEFFRQSLASNSSISWETPIAHIIKRTPTSISFGDSCLEGCGGYDVVLRFWWHLEFPEEVMLRTLRHRPNNKDGLLISINVLEFLTVIINYCAALTAYECEQITEDPYPILLNKTDNTSALNWTMHACKDSMIGRRLGRFFCWLMIDSKLGINSDWISTDANEAADEISRLKKASKSSTPSNNPLDWSFDYSSLKQKYTKLKACRFFQPSPELLSLIWDMLLKEKSPTLEEIQTLKQKGLGKLIG